MFSGSDSGAATPPQDASSHNAEVGAHLSMVLCDVLSWVCVCVDVYFSVTCGKVKICIASVFFLVLFILTTSPF